MTLHLRPEIVEELKTLAAARGLSIEDLLQELIRSEMPDTKQNSDAAPASGMVEEDGLLVYRTGRPLPAHVVDEAIERARHDRSQRILGDRS